MRRRFAALALLSALAAGPAWGLDLDAGGQRLVDRVNRGVNGEFPALRPFADPNGDGVWDCENYAAEKMARLAAAGVPARDMALQRVFTSRGQSHAVLLLRATRKGRPVALVLDNLSQWAVAPQALPYTGWEPLGDAAGMTAATPHQNP